MRKTAFILAGAAAFDLGVMAVSAQAQQAAPTSGPAGPETPGACAQFKDFPDARVSACREPAAAGAGAGTAGAAAGRVNVQDLHVRAGAAPAGPATRQQAAVDYFIKLSEAYPARSCTAARGQVVNREGVQQCRLPGPADAGDRQDFRVEGHLGASDDANGASSRRAGPGATGEGAHDHKLGISLNFTKIDIDYTARTCIAQRGEVVTRDGVQQCALPDAARANPGRERLPAAPALPRE